MILDFTNLSADHTRRLNEIAKELKKEYAIFVDDCCRKYGNNELFWATPFVSRNIFNDGTFLSLCRIMLAKELIIEGGITKIVATDHSEAEVLSLTRYGGVRVESRERRQIIKIFKKTIDRYRGLLSLLIRHIYLKSYGKKKLAYPEEISLVITPIISSGFDGYVYYDRYTTGIESIAKVFFWPCITNNKRVPNWALFDMINNCSSHSFLCDSELLSLWDVKELFRYWRFCKQAKRQSFYFDNMDVSALVRKSLEIGKYNSPSLEGLLAGKMLERMRRKGIEVKNFIIWYEGRPFDVYVSSLIRRLFPKSNCVGYQGFPLVNEMLSLYVSEYQYNSGHAPERMAIPSRMYEKNAKQFCSGLSTLVVPIFRNNYCLREKSCHTDTKKTILLLLPFFQEAAHVILQGMNFYLNKNGQKYRILIKNHPVRDGQTAKDYGFDFLSFDPEYITGQLEDYLDEVDIVITSYSTSGLEVIFAGIPLIVYCPRGQLNYTVLPENLVNDYCRIVYSENELESVLEDVIHSWNPDYSPLKDAMPEKNQHNMQLLFQT